MKTKIIRITPETLKDRLEVKGHSINGIPMHLHENYVFERKEVAPDGVVLFHFFAPFGHHHTNGRGRKRYICHPLRRNQLESEERRN